MNFSSWPDRQLFHIMRRSKLFEIDLKAPVNKIRIMRSPLAFRISRLTSIRRSNESHFD